MDILVIWLVITPLFFVFGWLAGRIDMKIVVKQAKTLPQSIFTAIDAIIEQQSAIAVAELNAVCQQEPQFIDLHFCLGKIFRKRGENDLAIQLHTKMLNSQYIFNDDIRDRIKLELAQDFHHAGLIDRAESMLRQILTSILYGHRALELLLLIYQQDKNWLGACDIVTKLATSNYSFYTEVSQFYCELSQEMMLQSNYKLALEYANMALKNNKKCVRATLLLGEIHFHSEHYLEALAAWLLVEKQNHQYLPLVVDHLFNVYHRIGKIKECITLMLGYINFFPKLNIYVLIYENLLQYAPDYASVDFLRQAMNLSANARIAALLLTAQPALVNLGIAERNDIEKINTVILRYHELSTFYHCGCCNFKAKTFFWQCPACFAWESILPN